MAAPDAASAAADATAQLERAVQRAMALANRPSILAAGAVAAVPAPTTEAASAGATQAAAAEDAATEPSATGAAGVAAVTVTATATATTIAKDSLAEKTLSAVSQPQKESHPVFQPFSDSKLKPAPAHNIPENRSALSQNASAWPVNDSPTPRGAGVVSQASPTVFGNFFDASASALGGVSAGVSAGVEGLGGLGGISLNDASSAASAGFKSVLSFASFGLKTVVDAANAAGPVVGGQAYQVGGMHVAVLRELADGGFGTVFLVQEVSNPGKHYAMKKLLCQTKEQVADAKNELEALAMFAQAEHVIPLLDHCWLPPKPKSSIREVLMLFPLFAQGTAWDAVERASPAEAEGAPWPFPERRALTVVLGAARALKCIHDRGFCHRDVKPHNILLADDGSPVLMDLGSVAPARHSIATRQQALLAEEEAAQKTSAPYRPPELTSVTHPSVIDERVDVWGLGCTLFCLAFGRSPFESAREGVLRLAILNGRYTVPAGRRMRSAVFSQGYVDLIKSMLEVDPSKRPFARAVIATAEALLVGCK